ncbi:MAG TPA: MBL fold metallo-hydrolase [Rhabdochlamydiaceae bacterium]|nr:MBL fold metallo-hydrolase [Rhabdochlamydiaceae bacterium]
MKSSFLFLGTGASMGTPVLTCQCAVCSSSDMHNQRLRPSGLLKIGDKRFLIDVGPDYRMQALKYGVERLDGVLITHTHYDHIAGLDDLRVYYFFHKKTLPCLLSDDSLAELKIRNHYFFEKSTDDVMGGSRFNFEVIKDHFGSVDFGGEQWQTMTYEQGGMKVTGYRWGKFAYVMDLKNFTEEIYSALKGVEVLIMSALRYRPSPAHLTMEEAVVFAKRVGAKQTWFSHVAHDLDHATINRELPEGMKLAHDGLEIDVN